MLTIVQIVADAGAPYEEVKHNGYVVLCSTSMGGHLGWFQPGGERWFSKAVSPPFSCNLTMPLPRRFRLIEVQSINVIRLI